MWICDVPNDGSVGTYAPRQNRNIYIYNINKYIYISDGNQKHIYIYICFWFPSEIYIYLFILYMYILRFCLGAYVPTEPSLGTSQIHNGLI